MIFKNLGHISMALKSILIHNVKRYKGQKFTHKKKDKIIFSAIFSYPCIPDYKSICIKGGRRQWAVYFTSSKYNDVFLFVGLSTLGTFIDYDLLVL